MDNYINFETYLFLGPKKFIISVNTELNREIYKKELIFDQEKKDLDLKILSDFLNENIFKIEKLLNSFVKSIYLIIDIKIFFSFQMSIKKNNYGELLTTKNLNYVLNEAKDLCSDTLKNKKIIHILIDNYLIDEKKYTNLPQNMDCNHFSLDINFICLSLNYLKNLEKIINKYQISINKIISMQYLDTFFSDESISLTEKARKIIDGQNPNEVILTNKKLKNKTFFEKFFHFFS